MDSTILILEDCDVTISIIEKLFSKKAKVRSARDTKEARLIMDETKISLLIADVELPNENGFEFLSRLQCEEKHRDLPFIFLTSRSSIVDKVLGFSLGAEDYIVKPFDLREFQLRVETKLRKIEATEKAQLEFRSDPFLISVPQQRIFRYEKHVQIDMNLSALEFKILFLFIRRENHILSREQILNEVWSDRNVSDRTVDTQVYLLRKKMGNLGELIRTEKGQGYRYSKTIGS